MKYKLLKKAFGTGKITLSVDFEFNKEILDICHIEGGVLFIAKDYSAIGFIDNKGNVELEWMGNSKVRKVKNGDSSISLFLSPEAIFSDNRFVYILDDGGNYLRNIDVKNKYVETITGKNYIQQFKKYYKKESRLYGVSLGRNSFFFSSSKANKCFGIQGGKMIASIGDGRPRFCSSISPKNSSFNNPMGIAANGSMLYISDNKNTCIRSFDMRSGMISVAMGCPPQSKVKNTLKSPEKIVVKKGQVFILDDGKIKFSNNEMHNSKESTAFDIDSKLNAYILEKTCGEE